MKKLQSRAFFLLFVYFAVLLTVRSTYVIEAIPSLEKLSKYSTVLTYLPFLAAIAWKFIADVCQLKRSVSSVSNCIYYAFALYYVAVSVYRFTHGMEVKENLYFSIVFFGSVAIYMLLRDGKIFMPKKDMEKNILWITVFFILYRVAYVAIGAQFFSKAPINLNLTSGAVAILLPFIGNLLTESKMDKKKSIFPWIVFCAGIIVIATTGARALFALTGVTVAVLLLVALIKRKGVLRLVSSFALACILVLGMAFADVADVRYAIYRQTGIDLSASFGVSSAMPTQTQSVVTPSIKPGENVSGGSSSGGTSTPGGNDVVAPEEVLSPDQLKAQKQINASDRMRKKLVEMGIQQVKESPVFGTGDVMYKYRLNKKYEFMQSPHNFLLEALVCYGALGLVMIAALFIALLSEMKLFSKPLRYRWSYRVTLLLTMGVYFAFGFVQPTVFDSLICPLFVVAMAAYRKALQETQ